MYVLGIPERPRRRAEELVGPRALAASILLPSRISWLENIRSGPYLVRSRGLKDSHRRLSLLTERSLQDSWTPPLSTASSCSGPQGTSATLSAMPPAVFLQTPLPAVPQGPVPKCSVSGFLQRSLTHLAGNRRPLHFSPLLLQSQPSVPSETNRAVSATSSPPAVDFVSDMENECT